MGVEVGEMEEVLYREAGLEVEVAKSPSETAALRRRLCWPEAGLC